MKMRTRPDLRLPADSLLPGQMPTQEAKRSAVPKAYRSNPGYESVRRVTLN